VRSSRRTPTFVLATLPRSPSRAPALLLLSAVIHWRFAAPARLSKRSNPYQRDRQQGERLPKRKCSVPSGCVSLWNAGSGVALPAQDTCFPSGGARRSRRRPHLPCRRCGSTTTLGRVPPMRGKQGAHHARSPGAGDKKCLCSAGRRRSSSSAIARSVSPRCRRAARTWGELGGWVSARRRAAGLLLRGDPVVVEILDRVAALDESWKSTRLLASFRSARGKPKVVAVVGGVLRIEQDYQSRSSRIVLASRRVSSLQMASASPPYRTSSSDPNGLTSGVLVRPASTC